MRRWQLNNRMLNTEEECSFIKSALQDVWDEGSIGDYGIYEKALLEESISIEEIEKATCSLRTGMAAGSGFSADFQAIHRRLCPETIGHLSRHPTEWQVPWKHEDFTFLYKKGWNPQKFANYHPIFLLNVDENVLTQVLATLAEVVFTECCICVEEKQRWHANSCTVTRRRQDTQQSGIPFLFYSRKCWTYANI